jgi:hypothetical protein
MPEPAVPAITDMDLSEATPESFARALFDRPITTSDAEKDAMVGRGGFDPNCGDETLVQLCTRLFERFGELSDGYSAEQIDQGLRMILGNPYFLPNFHLTDQRMPTATAVACIEASYKLYAEFLTVRQTTHHVGSLYMWWDQHWREPKADVLAAMLSTMERVLSLPETQCRRAALHGLAHFKQDWDEAAAKAVIERFLDREQANLSAEMADYAQFCRDHFHV